MPKKTQKSETTKKKAELHAIDKVEEVENESEEATPAIRKSDAPAVMPKTGRLVGLLNRFNDTTNEEVETLDEGLRNLHAKLQKTNHLVNKMNIAADAQYEQVRDFGRGAGLLADNGDGEE